eukprot:COSAG02_NODE_1290_length_13442_cov_6.479125_3_plen_488_part_00
MRQDFSIFQSEVAREREATARATDIAERERLRLAHVALDAEALAARNRAACAEREAETDSLKDSMATLSRSHKYYSRQLSLLSRQHAQWVSSVSLPSIQHQLTQTAGHQNSSASVRGVASGVGQVPLDTTSEAPGRIRTDEITGSQNPPVTMTAANPSSAAARSAHNQSSLVMEALRQDMQTFLVANLDVLASGGGSNTATPGSLVATVETEFSSPLASSEALLQDWRQSTSILLPADTCSLQQVKPKMRRSGKLQRRARNSSSISTRNSGTAGSVRSRDSRRNLLCHTNKSLAPLPTIQQQAQPQPLEDNLASAPGLQSEESERHLAAKSYTDKYENCSPLEREGWATDVSVDASALDDSVVDNYRKQLQSLSTAQGFRRSMSPPRSTSSERPRTRDRPRDMLEGVIYTVWERVHGEAEQWVQQAALLARYKGDMVRVAEENRNLRHALQEAKNAEERRQKQLEAVHQEGKDETAVIAVGAEVSTS